jgi:hypothetical protein
MQMHPTDAFDLTQEDAATQAMYATEPGTKVVKGVLA